MQGSDDEVVTRFRAETEDFSTGVNKARAELDAFGNQVGPKLSDAVNRGGFHVLTREMLGTIGLGGQMRALMPLVRVAEEGVTTATTAMAGSFATLTFG